MLFVHKWKKWWLEIFLLDLFFYVFWLDFCYDFVSQAVAVAKNAAKGIAETQNVGSDVEPVKEGEEVEKSVDGEEVETDEDKRRKSALDKLEKASDDSMFGQARNSHYWDWISLYGS